jgi:hypothetical protein
VTTLGALLMVAIDGLALVVILLWILALGVVFLRRLPDRANG